MSRVEGVFNQNKGIFKGVHKTVTTFQHHDFNYNTGKADPLFSATCGGIFYTRGEFKVAIQRYIIACKTF